MRHELIPVSDIPATGTVSADLLGREILVTMVNGKPRAFVNVCMHHGGPLSLEGDTFVCAWHGFRFKTATGECALAKPATWGFFVLDLRRADRPCTVRTRPARCQTDHASHSHRGRDAGLRLRDPRRREPGKGVGRCHRRVSSTLRRGRPCVHARRRLRELASSLGTWFDSWI